MDRIVIDGLDLDAKGLTVTIGPGTSWGQALQDLGVNFAIEHVPDESREREISADAAIFLRNYEYQEPGAVLAIFWRHHSLEGEEFETVEEAERFIETGEDYGSLAGEAIVAGGDITVLD